MPDAHSPALSKAVDRSGISLPFHSELHSTAIAPAVHAKISPPTQQPAPTLAKLSVPIPAPAIPSRPSKDESRPPLLAEMKSLQHPGIKAVIGIEGTSENKSLPLCLMNPMPLRRSAPVSSKSAILHPSKDKLLQPIKTKAIISGKEQKSMKSISPVPVTPVVPTLPKLLAPIPVQVAPPHPSDDRRNLPIPAVPVPKQQPISKVIINSCRTDTSRSSPTAAEARVLPKPSVPVLSRHYAPPRLRKDKCKPPVKAVTA